MDKWIVMYFLTYDLNSLSTASLVALSNFNEVGRFSTEERDNVIKFIKNKKLPTFTKENLFSEWEKFKTELDKEIFELYGK